MKIQQYRFENDCVDQFITLVDGLYPSTPYLDLYKKSIRQSFEQRNPFFSFGEIQNFIASEGGVPVGHISAIVDKRLPNIGLVGFFEAKGSEVSKKLLDSAVDFFRENNITTIRGPINLSIWHRYRFVSTTDLTDLSLFEPFNPVEYPEYFLTYGFKVAEEYISGSRNDFTDILQHTKSAHEETLKKGFTIRPIDLNRFEDELKIFHSLSLKIFENSWSFVPISFAEFKALYNGIDKQIDPRYCEFISKEGKEIGFCFSIPDFVSTQKDLILKTIGLLPEYQGQSIGLALIYNQHIRAQEDGYERIIYALIRQGNRASQINPYGAKVFRQYQSYELII